MPRDYIGRRFIISLRAVKPWALNSHRLGPIEPLLTACITSCIKYLINTIPGGRVGTKILMIYINDIYHNSIIMIFSSENIVIFLIFWYFQNTNLLSYYLLTFCNSCISNTNCPSPEVIRCMCKNIAETFNPLGRAQQRHRRQTQTDGSCHKANVT